MEVQKAEAFKKFLNKQPLYLVMFGWVESIRLNLPTVSIEKAVLNFMSKNGLTDDDLNLDTAITTYKRMREDLREAQKTT